MPPIFRLLAEIRFAAIEELTVDDYDEAQRRAWASAADDDEALGAKPRETRLTLVALIGGGPVGFIALQDGGLIDQLYVHPAVARTGVASTLCRRDREARAARGIATLVTDASDTAKPLFEKRGYQAEIAIRSRSMANGLGNTRMTESAGSQSSAETNGHDARKTQSLFDTTLRDGAQMADVDFSLADKRHIAALLDGLGVDYHRGRLSRRQSARYGIFRAKTEVEEAPVSRPSA